ncbi:MAG: TolC family protein [Planctomycetota bacterium]|jgi:outer membrane protein TolC
MKKITGIIIFALLTVLLIGGCQSNEEAPFYKMKVPVEKTKIIETLPLEEFESEVQPTITSILEMPEEPPAMIDLTLEQSRGLAMENNLDLKVQLIAPNISQEAVNAERAKFEAAFFSNFNYYKFDQPNVSVVDIEGSQGNNTDYDFGVNLPLKTGGTITFDLAENRSSSNSENVLINPVYTNDMALSISQPLLRNAGVRTNTHTIRIAEYNKSITDARTKLEVIRVIAAMDRVYWRLYAAIKQLEVRKQQYDLANEQLERAKRFVNAGQHAQIEVKRAEAAMAQSLESIIFAENNLRNRQREMKLTLNKTGLETNSETAIIPTTEPNPLHYTFDDKILVDQAIENRMEMLELELEIAKAVSQIDYLKNQALPIINLNYTYNINATGITRTDSQNLLLDNYFADHRIGLQLNIPLGNEAAKSNLRQAYYQRRQVLASKEGRTAMIEVEVLNALDQLETNWQRILAARQSTLLEARLYEAEVHQFENGLTTSTDVREAQANLTNAQSTEINAISTGGFGLCHRYPAWSSSGRVGASRDRKIHGNAGISRKCWIDVYLRMDIF